MLIPTLLMTLLIVAVRWTEGIWEPYVLLLTADFQTAPVDTFASGAGAAGVAQFRKWQGHEMYLWYVHCLIHMMIVLYLAVLGLKAVGGFQIGLRRFLLGFFALACLGRFLLPRVLDPDFFVNGAGISWSSKASRTSPR